MTAASPSGDGGNIDIRTSGEVAFLNSSISAEVGGGPTTTGGNITISRPDYVVLDNGSRIVANAFEGQGGNIDITTEALLVSADSRISASSALGVDGVVQVNAPETELAGSLATLSEEFVDAAGLVTERCGVATGESGRFAVHDAVAVPRAPDDWLPSSLFEEVLEARAATSNAAPPHDTGGAHETLETGAVQPPALLMRNRG